MAEDYYKILGIDKNSSEEAIKNAYRKMAHKHHPDKSGGDEASFKKVNEAYQVLSNKEKRAQYDKYGRVFEGGQGGNSGGGNPFGQGFNFNGQNFDFGDMGDLGDMFGSIFEGFGMGSKRKQYERGADLEINQEITLKEAYTGVVKKLKFNTKINCDKCSGVGHFPESGFSKCGTCEGKGEIKETKRTFFGNFAEVRKCSKCRGLGKIPHRLCSSCDGVGRRIGEKNIEVNIGAGIEEGQIIKVTGAGESGEAGTAPGDLYVRIRVSRDKKWERHGDELLTRHETSLIDLLLTRSFEIENIIGEKIKLELPSGFKLGDDLTVSSGGMPRLGGFGRGKMIVKLEAQVPKKLNSKAKELLEQLKREID